MICLVGRSTESTGMNTFSGKRPREEDMAYLSTSVYMRQKAGIEKPQKYGDPTSMITFISPRGCLKHGFNVPILLIDLLEKLVDYYLTLLHGRYICNNSC